MSSNVGLSTPRGSGTSGYVQRNLSHLKPRENYSPYPTDPSSLRKHRQRKPDKQILDHDRLRNIEVKVLELRDKLEDEEVDEEEIETQTEALRKKLSEPTSGGKGDRGGREMDERKEKGARMQLKPHQVHEMAAAKIEESEKLRRALGIRSDYEEGSHWRRGEERMREAVGENKGDARDANNSR